MKFLDGKAIVTFVLFISIPLSSFALDVGLGVSRNFDRTQDTSGKDEVDPYIPTISIGHTWQMFSVDLFAPRFGYSRQVSGTNDRYGGDYKVENLYVLYDFLHPLSSAPKIFLRYGLGTFQKRTTGDGGTVTVPNGNSTATAYKPGASKATTTLTFNLGIDFLFGSSGSTFTDQGIRGEFYIYQPLDKEKRLLSMGLSYALYF